MIEGGTRSSGERQAAVKEDGSASPSPGSRVFSWLSLVSAAVPPRHPNDDEDEDDEEDGGDENDDRVVLKPRNRSLRHLR
jgi:hypothetical protein